MQDKDGEENRQGSLCYLCDTEEAAHRLRISFHDAMQLKESQENNRNSTLRATRKSAVPPLKVLTVVGEGRLLVVFVFDC